MTAKRKAPGDGPGADGEAGCLAAAVSTPQCTPPSPLAQTLALLAGQAARLAKVDRDSRRRRKHTRLARFLRGWLAAWGADV